MLPDERITDLYARLDTANSRIKELERTIANNALLEPLQVRRLKRERDDQMKSLRASLAEANALLREADNILADHPAHLQGNHPVAMQATGWALRVAAHLNPPSDLGLEGQRYEANDGN